MIVFYYIHQLFNVILTFFKIQNIQFSQNIIDVRHNNDSLVNNFKHHNFNIREIEIVFSNKFNSIKVRKALQISKTLRINIQLFSLNQFNKNAFKLMIVSLHLIVDTNFAFIFF